ncbi:MAG TPA: hypothetical protein VM290_05240 [Gaiellaceae bacterium]|nr:hypothetical protein [Gaiellaceae bacterium]
MEGRSRMQLLAAVVAIAVAALLAGCGGGDDAAAPVTVETERAQQELEEAAEAARNDVDELAQALGEARSEEDAAAVLDGAAEQLRERAEQVEDATADAELEEPRDRLAAGLRTLADDAEEARDAVERGEWEDAARTVVAGEGLREVEDALRELRERGIDVEPLAAAAPDVDAAELEQAARAARDDVEQTLAGLTEARSADDVAGRMEEGAERIRSAADDVAAAEADAEVQPAQQRLADALEDLASELDRAAPDVRDGNVVEAVRRAQALEAVDEVRRALDDLRAQGVDVPELTAG